MVLQVYLDSEVPEERTVGPVETVNLDSQELQVNEVLKVSQVSKVESVFQVIEVLKVIKVHKVNKVDKVLKVPAQTWLTWSLCFQRNYKVMLVLTVNRVQKAKKVQEAETVLSANLVNEVDQVNPDYVEIEAETEPKVRTVCAVIEVLWVFLVFQAHNEGPEV